MSEFYGKADPQITQGMMQHGLELLARREFAAAGDIAETAVIRDPNDLNGLQLLGAIHAKMGNYGTAMALARMTLQIAEAAGAVQATHWYNVGAILAKTYHRRPALEALDRAAALDPNDPDVANAYAMYWSTYGDPVKAEHYTRRALELKPDWELPRLNLAMALLSQDRWAEAWPHFEARKLHPDRWSRGPLPFPEWKGESCETLLIHGEQGLGDEIFNCSLVPRLADRVQRIVVEANQRLVSLMRRSLGCEVYGSMQECAENGVFDPALLPQIMGKAPIGAIDDSPAMPRVVAMGSLPLYTNATRENCANNAYLQADLIRATQWRHLLMEHAQGRPIIGLAWKGGTFENHEVLRNPPRELFRDLSPERYCLVSVQYGQDAAQAAQELGALHFQQAIDDLDEQAALIRACDKVVSVAQTAMHIAGGLNVPTYALIGQFPKWDCGQSGDSVPFWQSVKPIRQRDDDWRGVFDRLRAELGELPDMAKAERFGSFPLVDCGGATMATVDLTNLTIGGFDATPTDLRAAE